MNADLKIVDAIRKVRGGISSSQALDFLGDLRESGKSAQTYNHYLRSAKQFTRWLIRERRFPVDPLAPLATLNVAVDRRHNRRVLSTEEFTLLVEAARNGKPIKSISGPDRAMMYVLAGWTGFRKGEIGSLTRRSFRLNDDPATATVAACYSKRKRQDIQILHPEVVRQLVDWLASKLDLQDDDLLFPVSGKVAGGKERKTHKMMRVDLDAARTKWIAEGPTPEEQTVRSRSDFLRYQNGEGRFADFHSNRHMFITSLERAGLTPKMAQTLARHSDVRLTLGVYTHFGKTDQTAAIESLPAPPGFTAKNGAGEVPVLVPRGVENGARRLASKPSHSASDCTENARPRQSSRATAIAVTGKRHAELRRRTSGTAMTCGATPNADEKIPPAGFEPTTFGLGNCGYVAPNTNDTNQLGQLSDAGVPTVVPSDLPSQTAAEMARVVLAWPSLPPLIRQAILGMVDAVGTGE